MKFGFTPRRILLFSKKVLPLVGGCIVIALLSIGLYFLIGWDSAPRDAPEAERVLATQIQLPFQVLIPSYLPKVFQREKLVISTEQNGPNGEQMVQLVYPTRAGDKLTFYEWLPAENEAAGRRSYCKCVCSSNTDCNSAEMGFTIGTLRLVAKVSAPNILTNEESRFILDTLGPVVNRQVYTSINQVPMTYAVSDAVDIPINNEGVQELTLVVTPKGYSPEHFAVTKGVPVKLNFRQIGEVGCGDTLIFQYGSNHSSTLHLGSQYDLQAFQFTPGETGDFRFNCPHLYYRGVMTVKD